MKRCVFVICCDKDFGGAERRLIRIYNQLGKDTKCDLVFSGCSEQDAKKRLANADCEIQFIDKLVCIDNKVKCLYYFLRNGQNYDVIHFIDVGCFNIVVSLIGKIKKNKTIYTIASVLDAYSICEHRVREKMKLLLKLVSTVDLLYPWAYENLFKMRKGRNVYVTPGTYTDLHVFSPKSKENVLIYAAARLEPAKNPELLVEACLLCRDTLRAKGYKVILLGQGELEEKIRDKIASNQIGDFLIMPGYKKTSDYFPIAKGVFSLQKEENYPSQVIAEAAASGCYLMISNVGYSRKTADETFARFVNDSPEDLADAINEYISLSTQEQERMAQAARKYAHDHYSINPCVQYFQDVLQKTIST